MKRTITLLIVSVALTAGAWGQETEQEEHGTMMEPKHQMSESGQMEHGDTTMGAHDMMPMDMQGGMMANKAHVMVKLPTVLCDLCKERIETGLMKTEGILFVNVEVEKHIGHITYDGDQQGLPDLEKAIAALGYQANETPMDSAAYANLPDSLKVPD